MTGDTPLVGVGVVLLDESRILLIKRGHDPGRGLWAVPGGKVRLGETLVEAAIREVKEETGLDVDIGTVLWAGESISDFGHLVLIDFNGVVTGGTLLAGDDADDAEWVDLKGVDTLALTPTMVDLIELLKAEMS
jgi:ADP-ribose pyrophosphatase YjhB (NUDIX family)